MTFRPAVYRRIGWLTALWLIAVDGAAQRSNRSIMGEWEDPTVNMLVGFYPDSSFLLQTIFYDIKGTFTVHGRRLVLESARQRLEYKIQKLTRRKLVLIDAEGNVLAFLKKGWVPPDSLLLAQVEEYKLSTEELEDFIRYVEVMTLEPLTEAAGNNLRVILLSSFHDEPLFTVNFIRRAIVGYEKVRASHEPIPFARRRNDLLVDLYYSRLYDQMAIAVRLIRFIKRHHPIEFFDENTDLVFFRRVFDIQHTLFRHYLLTLGLSPYQYDRFQGAWERYLRNTYRNESIEFKEFLATADFHARLLVPPTQALTGKEWRRFKKEFRKQSFSSYLKPSRLRLLKQGEMLHWKHAFGELGQADLQVWYQLLAKYTGRPVDPWKVLPLRHGDRE